MPDATDSIIDDETKTPTLQKAENRVTTFLSDSAEQLVRTAREYPKAAIAAGAAVAVGAIAAAAIPAIRGATKAKTTRKPAAPKRTTARKPAMPKTATAKPAAAKKAS